MFVAMFMLAFSCFSRRNIYMQLGVLELLQKCCQS